MYKNSQNKSQENNSTMQMSQNPALLIKAMQEHELLISRLYSVFADKYPEQHDFWKQLSEEELRHADWIKKILMIINENSIGLVVERYPMAAIESSLTFIKKLIHQFSTADLPLIRALSHASYIEKALIENKYFEIFQTENTEFLLVLKRLKDETEKHSGIIQELMANIR